MSIKEVSVFSSIFSLLQLFMCFCWFFLFCLILHSSIFLSSSAVALCIICNVNMFVMLIDSLMICNDCIKVNNDVTTEEDVEKELTHLTWDFAVIKTSISILEDLVNDANSSFLLIASDQHIIWSAVSWWWMSDSLIQQYFFLLWQFSLQIWLIWRTFICFTMFTWSWSCSLTFFFSFTVWVSDIFVAENSATSVEDIISVLLQSKMNFRLMFTFFLSAEYFCWTFKATFSQKSCSVKVIHSFFFIKYQIMMIFINTNTHFRSMKSTCSKHLCICSWCRSWRLTSFSSFIVICKTSLMMKVTSYLTVMFMNDLSDSSDDFDFVDFHLFIDAVSFVNWFEAAWVLDWLSSRFFSFSFSSSNQSSFADDDTHALQATRVAAVLATKITSSLEVSAFTAWEAWEALRGLGWEILRRLSLSKGRSSTSESVGDEEISASEESTIEFLDTIESLDTGAILRALEVLSASRWSRALKGALLRPVRLGGILTI